MRVPCVRARQIWELPAHLVTATPRPVVAATPVCEIHSSSNGSSNGAGNGASNGVTHSTGGDSSASGAADGTSPAPGDAPHVIHTLTGPTSPITCIAWSPDGSRLLSAAGSRVWVWDTSTGAFVRRFSQRRGPVLAVAWLPDGKRFVCGGVEKCITMWHVDSGCVAVSTPLLLLLLVVRLLRTHNSRGAVPVAPVACGKHRLTPPPSSVHVAQVCVLVGDGCSDRLAGVAGGEPSGSAVP